jgi:nucleoside-diphosphate-sugar epimerase
VVLRFAAFYGEDAFHVPDMIRFVSKGWAPLPGSPEAYVSSVAHDDAASAVMAALRVPVGTYNVTDDEPLRRHDYADALAAALQVASPQPFPPWLTALTGSMGKFMSRSLRVSNRLLRRESGWQPRYPSLRQGWPATIEAMHHHDAAMSK